MKFYSPFWVCGVKRMFACDTQSGLFSGMRLDKYLSKNDITSAAFAKAGGFSIHAVNKWRQSKRVPRPEAQKRIKKITNDKVTHKDWYE